LLINVIIGRGGEGEEDGENEEAEEDGQCASIGTS
jgi:hypothetical protein